MERRQRERRAPVITDELGEALEKLSPEARSAVRILWDNLASFAVKNASLLDELKTQLEQASTKVFMVVLLLAVVILASGAVSTIALLDQAGFPKRIQSSRVQASFDQCNATNARNKNTINKLNSLVKGRPTTKEQQAGTKATISLINAIVPYRKDCMAYARQITRLP